MIKAVRITLSGNITYEHVELYTETEQKKFGIRNYFEDAQIVFRCKMGKFIIPVYRLVAIHLNSDKTKFPKNLCERMKRISIFGDNTFAPAFVLNPGMHEHVGVPLIFKDHSQLTFACSEGVFITSDFQVMLLEM